ncbi:MAG: type I restriction enzyme HsdR N-terminal domain-containing protein [Salinivirgaceae bacterium]|nr:type I restriction enzyme HsdR N-terminal domain-containing protein [Salinivirgaceae bacterium]
MEKLNLPDYSADIRISQKQVFDPLRRKYVALTPEEWVRQNIIRHLLALGFPQGLISVEQPITYNGLQKRCDIVVYNRQAQPRMIVECKAPQVSITQKVFDQIAVYNLQLNVEYLLVTNGLQHFCCHINPENKQVVFLPDFPDAKSVAG